MNLLLDSPHLLDSCWLLLLKISFSLCCDKKRHARQYLTVINDFHIVIYYFLKGNFVVFALIIRVFAFLIMIIITPKEDLDLDMFI